MTYQEAAQNLINLYANYVDVCASNDEGWEDYSEEIAIAVEALLMRADQDRLATMHKQYLTQMSGVAPIPSEATYELLRQEDAFDKHFRMGDI